MALMVPWLNRMINTDQRRITVEMADPLAPFVPNIVVPGLRYAEPGDGR
ncbi:hypothetical protein MJ561_27595 [Klebsiella pneumoniae]|nr:hypothetical protein MJ561_27595 [Klebsiella pneumoniae]